MITRSGVHYSLEEVIEIVNKWDQILFIVELIEHIGQGEAREYYDKIFEILKGE